MKKVRIGITIGDINGIGPEVIIKALGDKRLLDYCIPVIYGNAKAISYHKNVVKHADFHFNSLRIADRLKDNKINVLNCWDEAVNITLGRPTEESGKSAHIALDRAVRDIKDGLIDVIVTAPVNKHALQMVNFPAPGHTEYLQGELGGEALMIMVSDNMKIGLVTGHIPLSEVSEAITKEKVKGTLDRFITTLKRDFGYEKPSVAVLGLNPHASDNGLIGTEEDEIIRPVIIEMKKAGNIVMGPFSADGFFGSGAYTKYDGILAMYHDQGLIPFKTLSFGEGVNFTSGLPYVRTSPDHGTAYDLAGKDEADPGSMRKALYVAMDVYRSRKLYEKLEAHSIHNEKEPENSERGSE